MVSALTHLCAVCRPQVWLEDCRASFAGLTREKIVREAAEAKAQETKSASQPDELIDFVQLKARKGLSQIEIEDQVNTGAPDHSREGRGIG